MRYAILSIDNSRAWTRDALRLGLVGAGHFDIGVRMVDGRNEAALNQARAEHPHTVTPNGVFPLRGHLGVWYSVLNALQAAPLLVVEDDALLKHNFKTVFDEAMDELPGDADFLSLYVPDARHHLFNKDLHEVGLKHLTKVWQPNGGVAVYWTAWGARRFRELVARDGLRAQWDNQLMQYAWDGQMDGYSLRPFEGVVEHAYGKSIVQNTEPA